VTDMGASAKKCKSNTSSCWCTWDKWIRHSYATLLGYFPL